MSHKQVIRKTCCAPSKANPDTAVGTLAKLQRIGAHLQWLL